MWMLICLLQNWHWHLHKWYALFDHWQSHAASFWSLHSHFSANYTGQFVPSRGRHCVEDPVAGCLSWLHSVCSLSRRWWHKWTGVGRQDMYGWWRVGFCWCRWLWVCCHQRHQDSGRCTCCMHGIELFLVKHRYCYIHEEKELYSFFPPILISAAARCTMKRAMGRPGHILRVPCLWQKNVQNIAKMDARRPG